MEIDTHSLLLLPAVSAVASVVDVNSLASYTVQTLAHVVA